MEILASNSLASHAAAPRENFPVSVFRHLERRLRELRRAVAERATASARKQAGSGAPVFTVTEADTDRALKEIVDDHRLLQHVLQFPEEPASHPAAVRQAASPVHAKRARRVGA